MTKKIIIRILLVQIFTPLFAQGQQTTNRILDSLTTKIQKEYSIPAMVTSAITSDTVLYGKQGTTKFQGKDEVTLDHKFHLGSNSKAITSFIAMQLVKEDRIRFETKFIDLFPELKDSISEAYVNISLGDLLSHKARVQPYISGLEFQKVTNLSGDVPTKRYAFTKFVLNEKTVEIGTYSNAGYVIASLMMEKASSQTFEKLVKGNLTKMKLDCFFGFPNQESEDNPWGHWEQFGQFISLNPQHPYKLEDFMLSAGDISMNILDYSRFIQIHLRGLNGRDDQLTKKDFEELHYKFNGYAYGWGNSNINSKPVSFHDGSTGTFYCHTIIIPSIDLAVVVMTNSAKEKHIEAIYKLRELIVSNQNTLR